jgi:sigma-E factor negative regulatory protein RseB
LTPRSSEGRKRQLLVLTAILAMGAPGCLLVGCTGQASQASQAAAQAAKPAGTTPAPRPARKRNTSPLALSLMTEAARAAVVTSYQGEEIDSRWDTGGDTMFVSDIAHVSDGLTMTRTQAAGTGVNTQPYSVGASPEGVLGVTTTLVQLLQTHYVVAYAGSSSAGSRPVQVVEAWRADGSLAARFLLDQATRLPLQRWVFDPAARLVNVSILTNVQVGKPATETANAEAAKAAFGPAEPAYPQPDPQAFPLQPAKLRGYGLQGWRVPVELPGGLMLFTGGETSTPSGPVLDLGYSDGLYVVSLFEQHGKLATKLAGWQKVTVAGRAVYAAGPAQGSPVQGTPLQGAPVQGALTWVGSGMVYTLIADAPAPTVASDVGVLPYDKPPGFWKRMSRGMSRLASLVNPFR